MSETIVCEPLKDGVTLVKRIAEQQPKRILLPFFHGVGDVVMMLPLLTELRARYPDVQFDLGLCRGLDQEKIVPEAVLLDGDWREKAPHMGYDLIVQCNFPLEELHDTSMTKAEVCCVKELGIPPICGHEPLKPKPIVTTHFFMTSVPWVSNTPSEVAQQVWNEIWEAGGVPVDTHMMHPFHNPENKAFDWMERDNHVRGWPAKLDTLIAMIGASTAFIGCVSGNFHLALSILGPDRVLLLEKDLRVAHFTKAPVASVDTRTYVDGSIRTWLTSRFRALEDGAGCELLATSPGGS